MKTDERVVAEKAESLEAGFGPPAELEEAARPRVRFGLSWKELRATDRLLLSALGLMTFLTIVFQRRIDGWEMAAVRNAAVGAFFVLFVASSRLWSEKTLGFVLRMAGILLMLGYINTAVEKLQLIIYGRWLDASVVGMERAIFGVQPTLWLQKLVSPALTEWLMFAYVAYLPLHPAMAGLLKLRRGESAVERLYFTLVVSNVICDFAFILYPVAGPLFHMGSQYSVPLQGFFWTRLGEAMRVQLQFVGGTIPSPHCANSTVMWLMAYRYHRPAFWILTPLILSVYVSTFYCRYHYVTDSVVGIGVGILAFVIAPAIWKRWAGTSDPVG